MTNEFNKAVIALVKSALTGEAAELPEQKDIGRFYKFAVKHNIVVLMYYGLINSGMDPDSDEGINFFIPACQYIAVAEHQMNSVKELFAEFEKQGIDHMPLKGVVIRDLYPKPEMRAMGDADILIRQDQYDGITPILERTGYEFVKSSKNEYAWQKQDFYLELHRYLLSPDHSDYFEVIGDGWQFAEKSSDSSFKYRMSDEDLLVHLVVHFAKHYRSSGIGIRHVTDIWLFLKTHPQLDTDRVKMQLTKLKLDLFYENLIKTATAWFGDGLFDEVTELMTEKVLQSGSFGTPDSYSTSQALKDSKRGEGKSRSKRFWSAVFLPYANMCLLFPVLKKCPVLLPFLWVWRIISTAFNKKGRLTRHYNSIKLLSSENIKQYEKELNAVGLEYRFEEDD